MAWRAARAVTDRHVAARIAVWDERARNVVRLTALWDTVRAALRIGFIAVGLFATYVWLDAVLLALPWTREAGARRWRWCPVRSCASPAASSRRSRS